MKLTHVQLPSVVGAQPGAQEWTITTPVESGPQRFFRRELILHVGNPLDTEVIVIDPAATKLQVKFESLDYNALANTNGIPASTRRFPNNTTMLVEMEAPREFLSLNLALPTVELHGKRLELYRVDGDAIVDKPTQTRSLHPFVQEFAQIGVSFGGSGGSIGSFTFDASRGVQLLRKPFIDARFAVRVRKSDESFEALNGGKVTAVNVQGVPTGVRIGIKVPSSSEEIVYIARPEAFTSFAAGNLLAKELNSILERLPSPLPVNMPISLLFESDAPCRVQVTQFAVVYTLRQQSFPSGEEKQVLRFAGQAQTKQSVQLEMPNGVTVTSAVLEATESFGSSRSLNAENADAALQEATGVHIDAERWAAQTVTHSEAISVDGLAVALLSVQPNTELVVQVREDWQGGPTGTVLTENTVTLDHPGERRWVALRFPQPVILNAQPYWIVVRAASGAAVWLASPGTTPLRVFSGDVAAPTERSQIKDLQALHYFQSSLLSVLDTPPIRLFVNGQLANAGTVNAERRQFDIRAALNSGSFQIGPGKRAISLEFVSDLRGSVTVYPPVIDYDLNE